MYRRITPVLISGQVKWRPEAGALQAANWIKRSSKRSAQVLLNLNAYCFHEMVSILPFYTHSGAPDCVTKCCKPIKVVNTCSSFWTSNLHGCSSANKKHKKSAATTECNGAQCATTCCEASEQALVSTHINSVRSLLNFNMCLCTGLGELLGFCRASGNATEDQGCRHPDMRPTKDSSGRNRPVHGGLHQSGSLPAKMLRDHSSSRNELRPLLGGTGKDGQDQWLRSGTTAQSSCQPNLCLR